MDAERFDALARTLNSSAGRRGVLSALAAAAGLAMLRPEPTTAKRRRGKSKKTCIACGDRSLTRGADLKGCDLTGRDLSGLDLRSADLAGACLQNTRFVGTELRSADLENADVRGADLTDANLDRADIRNWQFDRAIFCRTTMPDGSVNNGNCPPGSGSCLVLGELCNALSDNNCCNYGGKADTFCDSGVPFVTTCQLHCRSDADCAKSLGTTDVYCPTDFLNKITCARTGLDPDVHCCARKFCGKHQDCQSGLCCQISNKSAQCCLPGERCLPAPLGCGR